MRPNEIVEFSEALAGIAASGGGPKALVAHLAKTTGGGVLLEDAQWRHLATAGSGEIPASARGVVESGAPGRVQRVGASRSGLGWLSLFGGNETASSDLLLRLTAAVVGVELARNGVVPGDRRREFWESCLAGDFRDAASAREEAARRGITLAPQYLAVALEVESRDGEPPEPAELRTLATTTFRALEGDIGTFERGATLFVFVPATRPLDLSNAVTAATLLPKTLARRASRLCICGGVGTVEPAMALCAAAANAEAALSIGRRLYGSGRVIAYSELGAYRLLYEGADVDRLRRFASEVLAPLRNYDEKHQTELQRTLKLYFGVGQNIKTAAAELGVHRHTVFYRLRQIGEICKRSLDTPHDQLTLRLAVAIDELHRAL